mmetsp:Transcript_17945/g.46283  ORF Transcript_17945/g.46283 Transcript_17945/m.46283 type:complete len:338 (-) Transcript_17945:669-1682(-)
MSGLTGGCSASLTLQLSPPPGVERLITERQSSGLVAVVTSTPSSPPQPTWSSVGGSRFRRLVVSNGSWGKDEEEEEVPVADPWSEGSSSVTRALRRPAASARAPQSSAMEPDSEKFRDIRRELVPLMTDARLAYSRVLFESSKCKRPGCTLAIIATRPSHVSEPLSMSVSLESRYGGFFLGVPAAVPPRCVSASMQFASASSDWLIRAPSLSDEPLFWVNAARSEPARSMRQIFECSCRTSVQLSRPKGPLLGALRRTRSTVSVKTAWARDDCALAAVASTVRACMPALRYHSASSGVCTGASTRLATFTTPRRSSSRTRHCPLPPPSWRRSRTTSL